MAAETATGERPERARPRETAAHRRERRRRQEARLLLAALRAAHVLEQHHSYRRAGRRDLARLRSEHRRQDDPAAEAADAEDTWRYLDFLSRSDSRDARRLLQRQPVHKKEVEPEPPQTEEPAYYDCEPCALAQDELVPRRRRIGAATLQRWRRVGAASWPRQSRRSPRAGARPRAGALARARGHAARMRGRARPLACARAC